MSVVEAYGIRYVVDSPSAWILGAGYEPYMPAVLNNLPRNGVFLDIGAHVGKYAFYAARHCPDGLVVAVEPLPQNVENLRKGIDLNGFTNIRVIQCACGLEETKHIMLYQTGPTSSWKTEHGTKFQVLPSGPASTNVPVRSLDSIVEELELKRVDMLKLDVEQYELHVLKGSEKTLRRFNPFVQVECWDIGDQRAQVHGFMASLGYSVLGILFSYPGSPQTHPPYQDLVWKRKE